MPFPEYIQKNMTILKEEMPNKFCRYHYDYIQGTRFYSNEALNLKIASEYEYLLKVDLDVEFNGTLRFNLLHDMKLKGAIVGHTGAFPKGLRACTTGFKDVIRTFIDRFGKRQMTPNKLDWVTGKWMDWAAEGNWTIPCSTGVDEFEREGDMWYTNLIVYRTDFFQS
eukprot:CAMPEP_0113589934 /NCGR_PEP_ID=MMETSP0015_2-20120614/36375_1 /TAXON_ID=2838 /ORGANISM="Odontella" /LENGTH=166 /DNA_ID=CAMNT_0000496031 /DNA_START=71 /DNA_END=568 /DNA_ORIENTATION=+ /assembly_acc=CAM_ASM_000160